MSGLHRWIGTLLLRAPESLRSVRRVPILGDMVRRIAGRVLPKDEKVWAQIEAGPSQGLWLELNARTGQSYLRGSVEKAVQQVLAKRLRTGMVFYDLGANIGLFSLLAAQIVGPIGHVFSFEPDSDAVERLHRNICRNGLTNVTVVQRGLWSSSCNKKFFGSDSRSPDHGTGSFIASDQSQPGYVVRCVALDDFVQAAPMPDAIKCDVEGAEVEVLEGATKLLANRRPWIVYERHNEANDAACRKLLQKLGYNFDAIDGYHTLATPGRSSGAEAT